jgi:hypothetical protein
VPMGIASDESSRLSVPGAKLSPRGERIDQLV